MTQDIGALVEQIKRGYDYVQDTEFGPAFKERLDAFKSYLYGETPAILAALTTAVEIGRAMGREEAAKVCETMAHARDNSDGPLDIERRGTYRSVAHCIRSIAPTLDVQALTETVATVGYHARHGYDFAKATPQTQDIWRTIARAVLRAISIGGTAA